MVRVLSGIPFSESLVIMQVTGIRTDVAATSALIVIIPKLGEQSIIM